MRCPPQESWHCISSKRKAEDTHPPPLPVAGCICTSLCPKSRHMLSKQTLTVHPAFSSSRASPSPKRPPPASSPTCATHRYGQQTAAEGRRCQQLGWFQFSGVGKQQKLPQLGVVAIGFGSSLRRTNGLSRHSPSSARMAEELGLSSEMHLPTALGFCQLKPTRVSTWPWLCLLDLEAPAVPAAGKGVLGLVSVG